ncbi:hypothetical protein EG68_03516, partial [Paragonimus skrjabini miyazakii]
MRKVGWSNRVSFPKHCIRMPWYFWLTYDTLAFDQRFHCCLRLYVQIEMRKSLTLLVIGLYIKSTHFLGDAIADERFFLSLSKMITTTG